MTTVSFPSKIDKKTLPVVLPLLKEQSKKLPKDLLKPLTKKQSEAVNAAIKEGIPESGYVPVYSGDPVVFLLILGEEKKLKTRDIRDAGVSFAPVAKKHSISKVAVLTGTVEGENVKALREGFALGGYEYTEYKGKVHAAKKETSLKSIAFDGPKDSGETKNLQIFQRAVALTKDLVNCPPQQANPDYMEKLAKEIGAELSGVNVTIFKEKDLKKMGCNGILMVGQGSHIESRLIILEYNGGDDEKPIALVGKGVTYDTGGYSLKPSQYMESMKMDLGGAATVFGAFYAIAASGVKKNVVAVVPTVENTVNSYAYKPDDVIRMYNGVTVEVTNTDAEGRVILGDALAYTAKELTPRAMVNLATLTGACSYAVGNDFTAILGTDDELIQNVIDAGNSVDEPIWQLPLHQRYKKELESSIADIVNSSKLRAGTIEGGLFLQHFVPKAIPWCHMDIASVTFDDKKKLATGRNVRTLWKFVEEC